MTGMAHVLCHILIFGLGATGSAGAGWLSSVLKSTGRASGTRVFRLDEALAAGFFRRDAAMKNRWLAQFRSQLRTATVYIRTKYSKNTRTSRVCFVAVVSVTALAAGAFCLSVTAKNRWLAPFRSLTEAPRAGGWNGDSGRENKEVKEFKEVEEVEEVTSRNSGERRPKRPSYDRFVDARGRGRGHENKEFKECSTVSVRCWNRYRMPMGECNCLLEKKIGYVARHIAVH
ncbi:MAG: hypothetical protein JWN70_4088 [Planctomycetaceae bacterium]|nr:hypothetical protein [Planctomycetaceae bacterium]